MSKELHNSLISKPAVQSHGCFCLKYHSMDLSGNGTANMYELYLIKRGSVSIV